MFQIILHICHYSLKNAFMLNDCSICSMGLFFYVTPVLFFFILPDCFIMIRSTTWNISIVNKILFVYVVCENFNLLQIIMKFIAIWSCFIVYSLILCLPPSATIDNTAKETLEEKKEEVKEMILEGEDIYLRDMTIMMDAGARYFCWSVEMEPDQIFNLNYKVFFNLCHQQYFICCQLNVY